MVVQYVLPGEPVRDERARHEELPRLLPDLGLVVPEPEELRPNSLGRENGAALFQQRLATVAVVELFDLALRTRVYPVEDSQSQRFAPLVSRQKTSPDTTRAHGRDTVVGLLQELPADGDEVFPPHLLGVVLGPARAGQRELVRPLCGRDDLTLGPGEDTLR